MKNQNIYNELKRQKENYQSDIKKIKKESNIQQDEFIAELEGIVKGLNISLRIVGMFNTLKGDNEK